MSTTLGEAIATCIGRQPIQGQGLLGGAQDLPISQ
jgi:hypothetical protein